LDGGQDKLITRYPRTLANLQAAIRELPNVWVFDNDDLREPAHAFTVFSYGRKRANVFLLPRASSPPKEIANDNPPDKNTRRNPKPVSPPMRFGFRRVLCVWQERSWPAAARSCFTGGRHPVRLPSST